MTSHFGAFLLAATLLAVTPGPGIAYVVARTVSGGVAEGLASCLGTALGGMVHVAAAAFGLSALLAASPLALSVVKWIGAAYLVYLGLRLWFQPPSLHVAPAAPQGFSKALREGVVVEMLNVKTALFFLAFLPQFVDIDRPLAAQLLLLGTVCVVLNTTVDVLAVMGASRLVGARGTAQDRGRWLTLASGATMIAVGLYVAMAVT